MPTARAPTGIFMNSAAYLVANAGVATSVARAAAQRKRAIARVIRVLGTKRALRLACRAPHEDRAPGDEGA